MILEKAWLLSRGVLMTAVSCDSYISSKCVYDIHLFAMLLSYELTSLLLFVSK